MNCRHCSARVKKIGDYVPPTCGKSECQEAEYKANQERNKPKARRLKPKVGALKADGTPWTPREKLSANLHQAREERVQWSDQPGGVQKLELPVPSKTSNEYLFAKLINAVAGNVKLDYATMEMLAKDMGVDYDFVSDLLDRAEAVVARTDRKEN